MTAPPAQKAKFAPVLLSALVWPGAGQIYNREYRKGALLIVLALAVLIVFCYGMGMEVVQALPEDPSGLDLGEIHALASAIAQKSGTLFLVENAVLVAIWLYAVADAYVGSKRRV